MQRIPAQFLHHLANITIASQTWKNITKSYGCLSNANNYSAVIPTSKKNMAKQHGKTEHGKKEYGKKEYGKKEYGKKYYGKKNPL